MQLHGIIVHGQNGTVYDLSSAFNPEVDEYGSSVPPAFASGSLCILPGDGEQGLYCVMQLYEIIGVQ